MKAKKKKKASKLEWLRLRLTDGKEVTGVNVGDFYLGVNAPQGKSSMSSQNFLLSVWTLHPSPAFKWSLLKIFKGLIWRMNHGTLYRLFCRKHLLLLLFLSL